MNDIFSVSLKDLTPYNLINDKNISAIIPALDPQIQSVSRDILSSLIIPDINNQPDNVLDNLALQFHCDFYDLAQTPAMKKSAVSSSLHWHMKKGTPSAILEALDALGIDAEFIPWWKTGDPPYTFRIKANITGNFYMTAGKDRITRLITRAVNESKSARSYMAHLDTLLNFREFINVSSGIASLTSGHLQIRMINDDKLLQSMLYYSHISCVNYYSIIRPHIDKVIQSPLWHGTIIYEAVNQTIGVDLAVMQELLLQFEKRIFERIDRMEAGLNEKIETRTRNLDVKIDTVIEMLRWKGDDEEL